MTGPEEVGSNTIEAAWAGGIDGRQVIDAFLPFVPVNIILLVISIIIEIAIEKRHLLLCSGK